MADVTFKWVFYSSMCLLACLIYPYGIDTRPERQINKQKLSAADKLAYRGEHTKPIVDAFFVWCESTVQRLDLIATDSALLTALKYALNRQAGLRVFLEDPEVTPDT